MTTFNTGNPIGSTDARDLYDNAENFDRAVNQMNPRWTDRLGVSRRSWAGMVAYVDLGDYAADLLITGYNEIFRHDSEFYRAGVATVLPYTTTGSWSEDGPFFVPIGDAALRQDIAETADMTIGYYRNAVNCNQFGGLAAAIADSDTLGKIIVVTDAQAITEDTTVTGRIIRPEYGMGIITIAAGKTLTINSPFEAGAYQVFAGSGAVTGLKEARPEWWGGKGDGITDNTAPIQAAHDSLLSDGVIHFNSGKYLSDSVTISTSGIVMRGVGYESIIERKTDTTEVLINVTNHYFKLDNLKVQESGSTLTNTGKFVSLVNISDWSITDCWFFYGYDQLHGDVANNGIVSNCIFEGSRHAGIYGSQISQTRLNGNSFFNSNLDASARTAAIYLEKKAAYSFNAAGNSVTGNTFYSSRYGHFIHFKEISGSSITGNTFEMAGKFDAGSRDDIYIQDSDYIAIEGNSSVMVYNDYQAGNRATRYNVYLDANSTYINIGANAFLPGLSGTINDLTTDAGTSYDVLSKDYTPVWTADGTAPDIGDGTITGRWTRKGRTIKATISVTFGSTTTFGTSTYYFSLPKAATTTGYIGTARLRGPGATDRQIAMIDSVSGESKVSVTHVNASGSVSNIAPWTWANGNTIQIEVEYPI